MKVYVAGVQVKGLVERAYRRAKDLVQTNIDILHDVAAVLVEKVRRPCLCFAAPFCTNALPIAVASAALDAAVLRLQLPAEQCG